MDVRPRSQQSALRPFMAAEGEGGAPAQSDSGGASFLGQASRKKRHPTVHHKVSVVTSMILEQPPLILLSSAMCPAFRMACSADSHLLYSKGSLVLNSVVNPVYIFDHFLFGRLFLCRSGKPFRN